MPTPRRTPNDSGTHPRHAKPNVPPERDSQSDGYDADDEDPKTGFEPLSIADTEEDELGMDPGLSLDAEDLGPRMLESAMQSSRFTTSEANTSTRPMSEPGGLDLTQNVIDEGSLFDQPRDEGGTRHPEVRTNEVDAALDRNQRATRERLKRGTRQR